TAGTNSVWRRRPLRIATGIINSHASIALRIIGNLSFHYDDVLFRLIVRLPLSPSHFRDSAERQRRNFVTNSPIDTASHRHLRQVAQELELTPRRARRPPVQGQHASGARSPRSRPAGVTR